jgi:2-oxoglutarate dehydrogenase E2 component (dihydrolipoamide succinyltransferase)
MSLILSVLKIYWFTYMAKFELKLPKMGESVAEATITNWLKQVGDTIEMDEAV